MHLKSKRLKRGRRILNKKKITGFASKNGSEEKQELPGDSEKEDQGEGSERRGLGFTKFCQK